MDARAAKLALARKKLKDHQDRKLNASPKSSFLVSSEPNLNNDITNVSYSTDIHSQDYLNVEKVEQDKFYLGENLLQTQQTTDVPEYVQPETKVTEILISNKRNLELHISDLQSQFSMLQDNYNVVVNNYKAACQKIQNLEIDLQNMNTKFLDATRDLTTKDQIIKELNTVKMKLCDENNNYQEQLEFTKTILTAKEAENNSLHSQLYNLQNQFDITVLQLQQLTNGSIGQLLDTNNMEQTEILKQKILELEQDLKALQKEREQINSHYELYTNELNEQLRSVVKKNEDLTKEVQNLSNRENNLIEQISDMEIRLQSYNTHKATEFKIDVNSIPEYNKLLADYSKVQENLQDMTLKHGELQKLYYECIVKIKQLQEVNESDQELNISLSKLNADIASDKVAAQIATEQNKKMKEDLQRLEETLVKMGKDKLDLTEKLTAEKYLSRELTLKLAEVEEKAKTNENKLKAKDGEMIRLQANYRSSQEKYEELLKSRINENTPDSDSNKITSQDAGLQTDKGVSICHKNDNAENLALCDPNNKSNSQKEDAMNKLQDRFLKIMEEVAALSDEKHRLEHIILQLQNETDTICEYVALYQQQRSLLKRRDEERSAQLKIFQSECERLRNQLEELTSILVRFVEDSNLTSYFQAESKRIDKEKVMNLLSTLKTNSLIDPAQNTLDFKAFYPCSCCSGKLIEV